MDAKICGIKDTKTLKYILNHINPPKFIVFPTLTIILRLTLNYNLESWINLLPYSIAIFTFLMFILILIFKLPKKRMKKRLVYYWTKYILSIAIWPCHSIWV